MMVKDFDWTLTLFTLWFRLYFGSTSYPTRFYSWKFNGTHGVNHGVTLKLWGERCVGAQWRRTGKLRLVKETVPKDQWRSDCETLITAWMYGNPPGGWSDPERRLIFTRDVDDLFRRLREEE